MNTALIEVNSTNLIIERAKQLCTIIEMGASKFSDREAESYSRVFDGMILAAKRFILDSKDTNFVRLTAIIEQSSTEDILEETTYLDTRSMNIMYGPPYLPDDNVAKNYTTVWVLTPSDSSSTAFVVRNYATPGATMQFHFNPSKKWWEISFDEFRTHDIFITDGDKERAALSTKIDDHTVYLVNISAIEGEGTDGRKAIVGATEDMVRTSVKMWKTESVTKRVKHEFPIGNHSVPLIPILPNENNAAVESSSCCSLT